MTPRHHETTIPRYQDTTIPQEENRSVPLSDAEVFEFVRDGMEKGAIGVNLGRNIWQNEYPVAVIKALRAIIHKKATPKEANEIFEQEKNRR